MSDKERFRIYIASFLILTKDKKILLQRRTNTGYEDGNYSLVSGHMEGGETAVQSIIREAKEEIGITLKPNDLQVVHVLHRLSSDREYINVFLKTDRWEGEIINAEPEKCDDLRWFLPDELPENMIRGVRFALENIAKGTFYSELGW